MNESGRSVAAALRFFKVAPAELLVVHDEVDLEPGRLQLRPGRRACRSQRSALDRRRRSGRRSSCAFVSAWAGPDAATGARSPISCSPISARGRSGGDRRARRRRGRAARRRGSGSGAGALQRALSLFDCGLRALRTRLPIQLSSRASSSAAKASSLRPLRRRIFAHQRSSSLAARGSAERSSDSASPDLGLRGADWAVAAEPLGQRPVRAAALGAGRPRRRSPAPSGPARSPPRVAAPNAARARSRRMRKPSALGLAADQLGLRQLDVRERVPRLARLREHVRVEQVGLREPRERSRPPRARPALASAPPSSPRSVALLARATALCSRRCAPARSGRAACSVCPSVRESNRWPPRSEPAEREAKPARRRRRRPAPSRGPTSSRRSPVPLPAPRPPRAAARWRSGSGRRRGRARDWRSGRDRSSAISGNSYSSARSWAPRWQAARPSRSRARVAARSSPSSLGLLEDRQQQVLGGPGVVVQAQGQLGPQVLAARAPRADWRRCLARGSRA